MTEFLEGVVDLFGCPVRRERGRGRPAHVWTLENSNKVNLLFACGYDIKDVAAALGITQPTLRKHYFSEVEQRRVARIRVRALQLERLNRAADAGNVAAEKALAGMIQGEVVKVISDRKAASQSAPSHGSSRVGKKEAAKQAAAGVTGKYAPPEPPALLLN